MGSLMSGPPKEPRKLPRASRAVVLLVLAAIVAMELVTLTGIVPPPHNAVRPSRLKGFTALSLCVASFVHAQTRPRRTEILATAAIAALIGAVALGAVELEPFRALFLSVAAIGAASLVVLASRVALAPAGEREERLAELGIAAVLPTFTISMQTALSLTVALHPEALDGALFQLDAAVFGGQPSFAVGALFRAVPALRVVCTVVYLCLPFAFAFVLLTPKRAGPPGSRADLLESFFAAGCAGFAVYHLVPALGPAFAFAGDFPLHAPPLSEVTARLSPPSLAPRNAVPSLHTAWALLLVWHARGRGAFARYASIAWLVLTVAATQGLGEHYLVDVVIAVPFAVALDALATRCVPIERRERALPAVAGIALVALWIVLARSEAARQAVPRGALELFVLVTIVAPLALRRALLRAPEREAPLPDAEAASPREQFVRALIVGTGVVGAAVVLLLDRAVLVAVGGDTRLSAVEVFGGLSGLGLGAWIGGRVAARRDDPARLHAAATIALGVYGALAPVLAVVVRSAFVALASGDEPWPRAAIVRAAIVGCAVILPAVAAGAALPFAARASAAPSWLPAALALGAAGGWIGAGDLVLPALGLRGAAALTLVAALGIALLGLRLARSPAGAPRECASAPLDRALVAGAGLVGGGLAVAFAHLLAITAGEGPYAMPSGLAAASLGLAAGAALAALRPPRPAKLGAAAIFAAVLVVGGAHVFDAVPGYLASYEHFGIARDAPAREIVRLAVAFATTAPPAAAVGFLAAGALVRAPGSLPHGWAGAAAGAVVTAFVVLPTFGALRALHAVAALAIVLALLPAAARAAGRPALAALAALAAAAAALLAAQPGRYDAGRLATGASRSFAPERRGAVEESAESLGGLVTLSSYVDDAGVRQSELSQRGRPLGSVGGEEEPVDQVGLGVYPLLHTQARGSALVLGAGTLSTALALDRAGLARVDVVEDDPYLVAFARRLRPAEIAAHVVVADARGFLLVTRRAWDVIVIDADDVWSPAGASLHTRELVALARARLAPGGVLAVSFPLHRVDGGAIVDFVATVHDELSSTWLYAGEARGAVVACAESCPPRQANLAALDRAPEAQRLLAAFGSARGARRHLVLDPPRIARLDRSGSSPLTDDDLRLAYTSQQGAALGYDATLPENRAFLASLSQRLTPDRP